MGRSSRRDGKRIITFDGVGKSEPGGRMARADASSEDAFRSRVLSTGADVRGRSHCFTASLAGSAFFGLKNSRKTLSRSRGNWKPSETRVM